MAEKRRKIMIVAGEASGDRHSARLVSAIRKISSEVNCEFFGAAGPEMRRAGVEAIVEADAIAIIGLPAILQALPMF
ncbi:MAG: lipid-A-disaccharide synthase, partial [Blastocatellia bacterium]